MAESGNAPDLKSEIPSEPGCVGSNPTPAAKYLKSSFLVYLPKFGQNNICLKIGSMIYYQHVKLCGVTGVKNFILGTIFGILICTVGFAGLLSMFDRGLEIAKQQVKEYSK